MAARITSVREIVHGKPITDANWRALAQLALVVSTMTPPAHLLRDWMRSP